MDIIEKLRYHSQHMNGEELQKLLLAAANEIERCHQRLEIDIVFLASPETNEMVEVAVPFCDRLEMSDGIDYRNETIRLLEEALGRLQRQLKFSKAMIYFP